MNKKTDYALVEKYSLIVDDFVIDYRRVPSKEEFKKLGGYLPFVEYHFGTYKEFINSIGYGKTKHLRKQSKNYYVIDTKYNNEVVTIADMKKLFKMFPNKTHDGLRSAIYQHHLIDKRYRILRDIEEIKKYE